MPARSHLQKIPLSCQEAPKFSQGGAAKEAEQTFCFWEQAGKTRNHQREWRNPAVPLDPAVEATLRAPVLAPGHPNLTLWVPTGVMQGANTALCLGTELCTCKQISKIPQGEENWLCCWLEPPWGGCQGTVLAQILCCCPCPGDQECCEGDSAPAARKPLPPHSPARTQTGQEEQNGRRDV